MSEVLRVCADRLGVHFSIPFQCAQPSLLLPDPQSALCCGVPACFCNKPPPTRPGGEQGRIAAAEDEYGGPGTQSAPSSIGFLVVFFFCQLTFFHHIRRKIKAILLYSQVTIHTDLEQAFQEADVILLLDEGWSDDSDSGNKNEEEKKRINRISDRCKEYGQLIDMRANKEVKVIVSGDSFVNLRCSLLLDNACSINSHQFVAVATQLENEARAIIAKKLKVKSSGS